MTAAADWRVWSCAARLVVTDSACLAEAQRVVRRHLGDVDRAASRFRADSELRTLPAPEADLSPLLADLLSAALGAAAQTGGAVDPTVGGPLADLGYDRDVVDLDLDGSRPTARVRPTPGWRRLRLVNRHLTWPEGVELDLGATAKARAADECARLVAERLGCGVLVGLGGDLATAGPAPAGGWQVTVRDSADDPSSRVTVPPGGALATSSTLHRTWRRGAARVHHLLDPVTARPVEPLLRTVSVAAGTCVAANTASTATIVKGAGGPAWLADLGLPARLVHRSGDVELLGGWPAEATTPQQAPIGVSS